MPKIHNLNKILIVEDDVNLGFTLSKFLEVHNCTCKRAKTGKNGIEEARNNQYDLCLIDIGLPDFNGLNIVKEMRNLNIDSPVIIITDQFETSNEIESYSVGSNIFHRKPLNYDLLIAQVNMFLAPSQKDKPVVLRDIYFDNFNRIVSRNNVSVNLTPYEFNLFLLFVRSKGKVYSREEILRKVFTNSKEVTYGAVDTLVSRLRKKLGKYQGEEIIETVFRMGYKLNKNYILLL